VRLHPAASLLCSTRYSTPAAPVPEGTDLGDAFLRAGQPAADFPPSAPPEPAPPAAEALLPTDEAVPAAEATPGADPTAEPPPADRSEREPY
jgi:hypothetical protein